jgi:hypothetical protein
MGHAAIPTLMIVTLVAALAIGIVLYLRHMRKPENRHPMRGQRERNIGEIKDEARVDKR